MFSKFSRSLVNATFKTQKASFASLKGSLLEVFNRQDLSDPLYQNAVFNPTQPLREHKAQYRNFQAPNYEISKLKNGITVLTESQVFPNVVDMGILLDVGTRDETHETSGSLLSIQKTYYKTVLNTNETINYGMVQMSGGEFEMDYNQESTYFKAHCLSHDVVDIFNMMADCALEPRSVVAANVAMDKIAHHHNFLHLVNPGELITDSVLKAAFGLHGLGMPLSGLPHNVKYLSNYVVQKFQLENINPNRITVCAAGIENHQEFVDLVESKLAFIPAVEGKAHSREASEYRGGELRNHTDANDITLALAFRSAPWNSKDVFALQVLGSLIGNASQGRTTRNLLKNNYIDSVHPINFNFSDAGLFGLTVNGSASNASEILEATVSELKGLSSSISKEDLQRAKNITKNNISSALERQKDRLEEAAKNVKTYGKVVYEQYANQIDGVTSEQISSIVSAMIASRPTFVAEGGEVSRLPSLDRIENLLKP